MSKVLLLFLIIIETPLIAMHELPPLKKAAHVSLRISDHISRFKKAVETGDLSGLIAVIRDYPEYFEANEDEELTKDSLYSAVAHVFKREQKQKQDAYCELVKLLISHALEIHRSPGEEFLSKSIEHVAKLLNGIKDENERIYWQDRKQYLLRICDILPVIGKIRLLEREKKQLYFARYGHLADFEERWHERYRFMIRSILLDRSADEILDIYRRRAKVVEELFAIELRDREFAGMHHIKMTDIAKDLNEYSYKKIDKICKTELFLKDRSKEKHRLLRNNFLSQSYAAVTCFCEEERPTNAQGYLTIFKQQVKATVLPRLLSQPNFEECSESALSEKELGKLKARLMVAEVRTKEAELLVEFARNDLEKLKTEFVEE